MQGVESWSRVGGKGLAGQRVANGGIIGGKLNARDYAGRTCQRKANRRANQEN